MNAYRLSITRNGGELVGTVDIDGLDLRTSAGMMDLAEAVTDEMGGDAIEECRQAPDGTPPETA